jgi:HEAT repeat protein
MRSLLENTQRLATTNWQERARAIEDLAVSEGPEVIGFLSEHLHDSNINVRNAVKTILIRKGDASLVRDKVTDQDPHVRIAAVNVLGQIGDRRSLPWVLDVLDHETDARVRLSIVDSLRGFLGSHEDELLTSILPVFTRLSEGEKLPFIYLLSDMRTNQEKVLPILYEYFNAAQLRPAVIEALGILGNSESLPYLINNIDDANTRTFTLTVAAIAKILDREPRSRSVAVALLQQNKWVDRKSLWERIAQRVGIEEGDFHAAVTLLTSLGGPEVLPELLRLLPHCRGEVAASFALFARKSASQLLPYQESENSLIRGVVGHALAMEGSLEVAQQIVASLPREQDVDALRSKLLGIYRRRDSSLQKALLDVTEQIVHNAQLTPARGDLEATILALGEESCLDWCRQYLRKQDDVMSTFALDLLARSSAPIHAAEVRPFVKVSDPAIRMLSAICLGRARENEAGPILQKLALGKESSVRERVAEALGNFSKELTLKILIQLQSDANDRVACEAIRSLAKRREESFLDSWVKRLKIPPDESTESIVCSIALLQVSSAREALNEFLSRLEKVDSDRAEEIREFLSTVQKAE